MDHVTSSPYASANVDNNTILPSVKNRLISTINNLAKYILLEIKRNFLTSAVILSSIPIAIWSGPSFLLIIPTVKFAKLIWDGIKASKEIDSLKDDLKKLKQFQNEWNKINFRENIKNSADLEELKIHYRVAMSDLKQCEAILIKRPLNLQYVIRQLLNCAKDLHSKGVWINAETTLNIHKNIIDGILSQIHLRLNLGVNEYLPTYIEELEKSYFG
jgi:hypothetical protein